ncbi:MAG TPA: phosphatase PAP2 family protein [Bacteroidales bacterium]|nr:phosphatase PAP2 family protein [Bacteroidales bacterium]
MHKITTIILLILTLSFTNNNLSAQNWDIETLERLNNQSEMKGFSTFISESTIITSFGIPVGIGITALVKDDDKMLKEALYIGASQMINNGLTYALKLSFNRERPYDTYPQLEPYKIMSSASFPSGHTSLAFSTATALSLQYPKWYIIAPSFLWASSVGYSRMNLGVHYPTDIIAGSILGAGSAYLTLKLNELFWEKKNHKQILTWQD